MRHSYSSITPGSIHEAARDALKNSLGFRDYKQSVSVNQLLDLLLFMAASCSSLFATVQRFFSFSHQTASQAVHDNLPGLEQLRDRLVQALFDVALFSRPDRRRAWMIAIDTNLVPFYGKPNPHVVGGPKKQGTKWFFGYATAVLLHKGRRFMVGLCPLKKGLKPHEIVRTLLDQIAGKGLKIKGVTLDSAFDSGDTIHLLQERKLAYAVPLRRKGSAPMPATAASRVSTGPSAGPSGRPRRPAFWSRRACCSGKAEPKRWPSPSRDGMATAPRTFTSKRCRAGNCIGAASASKRVIARRTKHKHSRPAVIRFTAYCWRVWRTSFARYGSSSRKRCRASKAHRKPGSHYPSSE